jgi:hypothetical protein
MQDFRFVTLLVFFAGVQFTKTTRNNKIMCHLAFLIYLI